MNRYPGKILLFGEYTLLYNRQALAMPFSKFSGRWNFESKPEAAPDLAPWLEYIKRLGVEQNWISATSLTAFSNDLKQGLWFDSNIPQGYGLGSSGALVAAWYGNYIEEKSEEPLLVLKDRFSKLESFFHGTSSGFDPLVSYLDKPIIQQGDELIFLEEDRTDLLKHFFILDTGIPRSTEPLVKWFRENIESDQAFEQQVKSHLVPHQGKAIEAFIKGDLHALKKSIKNISRIQMETMSRLIPEQLMKIWNIGLENQKYLLKLCGAGGGGVMLGIGELLENELESYPLA